MRLLRLAPLTYPQASRAWLFPSYAESGHLHQHREDRALLSHWGGDLRQSYRTLGQAAGLQLLAVASGFVAAVPGVAVLKIGFLGAPCVVSRVSP